MDFKGFSEADFASFEIDGLENRMEAIRTRIQPKFREIGGLLEADLSAMLGTEMFLHIAKHARRTVNAPKDTWLAIANNKRGYKKHPHFQVGLFDDRVFAWLAFIYELPNKSGMAETFLRREEELKKIIPADYVVSMDHMKKAAVPMKELDLEKTLVRFRDVKKAELLIGRHFMKGDPLLSQGEAFVEETRKIFETLTPIYKMSYQ